MGAHQPDCIILLGDNVYLEDHFWNIKIRRPARSMSDWEFATHLHERYARQWTVPEFEHMLKQLPSHTRFLGTVDDHDFLGNDLYIEDVLQPKARVSRILHRQFIAACNDRPSRYPALPSGKIHSGQDGDDPGFKAGTGLASHLSHNDVMLAVLDNRSYRQPPKDGAPVLGDAQLKWLGDRLAEQKKFNLVFSGSPLTEGTKWYAKGSPLSKHAREFRKLCDLYGQQAGRTVVHIGGDLHYNDFKLPTTKIPCTQVTSSALGSGWQPFSWSACGNYGLIEMDASGLRIRTFGCETARNINHLIAV